MKKTVSVIITLFILFGMTAFAVPASAADGAQELGLGETILSLYRDDGGKSVFTFTAPETGTNRLVNLCDQRDGSASLFINESEEPAVSGRVITDFIDLEAGETVELALTFTGDAPGTSYFTIQYCLHEVAVFISDWFTSYDSDKYSLSLYNYRPVNGEQEIICDDIEGFCGDVIADCSVYPRKGYCFSDDCDIKVYGADSVGEILVDYRSAEFEVELCLHTQISNWYDMSDEEAEALGLPGSYIGKWQKGLCDNCDENGYRFVRNNAPGSDLPPGAEATDEKPSKSIVEILFEFILMVVDFFIRLFG